MPNKLFWFTLLIFIFKVFPTNLSLPSNITPLRYSFLPKYIWLFFILFSTSTSIFFPKKDSLCSTNTDSSGTQSNSEGMEKPIWKHAFLNSKERRTLSPDWTGYVSEPCLCRGDDGLRGRVARLKALGNSIVPACAAVPLQRIKDLNSSIYNDWLANYFL